MYVFWHYIWHFITNLPKFSVISCPWACLEVRGRGPTFVALAPAGLLDGHLHTIMLTMEDQRLKKNLHLRQGPIELLAVLVVTLGEGDHPLIVSRLPAALAVLSEARPSENTLASKLDNICL